MENTGGYEPSERGSNPRSPTKMTPGTPIKVNTFGWTQETEDAEEVFMIECWERTKKNKDNAKCEACHLRFKCYTSRNTWADDDDDEDGIEWIP